MNLIRKIFSPTCFIVSILILIYTFYRSEITNNGDNFGYYKSYYIISSILVLFSLLSFFLNKIIKDYLIILSISFLITLYLFETFLYKKELLENREKIYFNQTGKVFDTRSKLGVYEDLNTIGEYVVDIGTYYYLLHQNKSDIFPLSGISDFKTIHCNENGYFTIYESDRYGFNNPDYEWDKNEIEYLLTGDSFVHGNCVNRPHDIASVLRDLSNRAVINLGYEHARGPLSEYASLREYLSPNVKKVIWFFYGNDLEDLNLELNNALLYKYLVDINFSQNLKFKQKEINNYAKLIIDIEQTKHREKLNNNISEQKIEKTGEFLKFLKIDSTRRNIKKNLPNFKKLFLQNQNIKEENSQTDYLLQEFKKILQMTKDLVSKNNSELYFVLLPEYGSFKRRYKNDIYPSIEKIVKELNITFIDIDKEVIKNEKDPRKLYPFRLEGHFNVFGYKKVSEAVYRLTIDK
tara:strand:+ start:80 stop:1468 length:1389 start_codon:yes stop_codon:yes gene_type:complete